jgi:hypothetical protein
MVCEHGYHANASSRVPEPHRFVVAAAGEQDLAVNGNCAHRMDPVSVVGGAPAWGRRAEQRDGAARI